MPYIMSSSIYVHLVSLQIVNLIVIVHKWSAKNPLLFFYSVEFKGAEVVNRGVHVLVWSHRIHIRSNLPIQLRHSIEKLLSASRNVLITIYRLNTFWLWYEHVQFLFDIFAQILLNRMYFIIAHQENRGASVGEDVVDGGAYFKGYYHIWILFDFLLILSVIQSVNI